MTSDDRLSRRDFVKTVVGGAAAGLAAGGLAATGLPLEALAGADKKGAAAAKAAAAMPTRPLGKTGFQVPVFSLGGQATLEKPGTAEESVAIINRAIDLGVRYVDTSRVYGKGVSELYFGEVMKTRRAEVFLASKTRDRTYDGSMRSLEESLKSLQTDHLDLWQLHNIMRQDDLAKIFAADGAIKALEKARDEKVVRFLGITGHYDPDVLRSGLQRYPFDTLLVALNAADKHRASFIDKVLPLAVEQQLGIIGMKIPARGKLFREGGITSMKDALGYVLTLPVSTVIVGITKLEELEENVRLAREFKPLKPEQMAQLEELTKPYFADATFFKAPA
jgi:hypothetical protein